MTVLVSTAYLDEAERCGAVLLMHEGRLIGEGAPGDVHRHDGRAQLSRDRARTSASAACRSVSPRTPGVLDAIIQGAHVRIVRDRAAVCGRSRARLATA